MLLALEIILVILKIILIIVFIFSFFVILVLFSPDALKAARKWSPFIPTSSKVIRKALKEADLRPGEILIDLGCGTGRVLMVGAKEFKAMVIGYEYSLLLFCITKINLFLHRIKNGKVFHKSFFEADMSSADVVYLFLTPKVLKKLEEKLKAQLKNGARIITFSSPLLSRQPEKIISLSEKDKKENLYLYIKK